MTIIEKILAAHSEKGIAEKGSILDVDIDARVARDFGGANVVKNLLDHGMGIQNQDKTFFTFDCNPTGSDQKYASNQHKCRVFARERGIKVYDIDKGIGTHILIEEGLAFPGSTAVSTDSHANILGAVGAFGQGMGDKDIAAAWSKGKVWFKVPPTAKLVFIGDIPSSVSAKDIVLNLLVRFGSSSLLGYAVELYGELIDKLSLDDRITISSMATEMGAIIILIPPNDEVLNYCEARTKRKIEPVRADSDADYDLIEEIDITTFEKKVSRPGKPHDAVAIPGDPVWIDSAFIGSCTNGRLTDLKIASEILKGRKVAPNVVLKIVPATNSVWDQALDLGYIEILKEAGALISNAGCAGCAAGQVGQNGPGEVTISTGNRNFPGKQGQGLVYLAGPDIVAASALAGYIIDPKQLNEPLLVRPESSTPHMNVLKESKKHVDPPVVLHGRAWIIAMDDIDTDMIFHNQHLAITDLKEMGKYTFGNLRGFEHFSKEVKVGDIVVVGRNFGSGSSRQQAVDCFKALGVSAIIADSFGAIYERNAINAAFPIMVCEAAAEEIADGEIISVDLLTGQIVKSNNDLLQGIPFSEVQMEIYKNNGLF